jgi:hypothetical protein
MPKESDRSSPAVAWAAIAYGFAAVFWVTAASIVVAAGEADGVATAVGWFLFGMLWIGIAAIAASIPAIPILIAEIVLWRFVARRFPSFERDRWGVARASAILALPWAVLNAIEAPGAAVITFGAAFAGLLLPRIVVRSLQPGALIDQLPDTEDTG